MNDLDVMHTDLTTAIQDVMSRHGHMMQTFIVIGDAIEAESGEVYVLKFATEGARRWQTLGLLHYALICEQAGETASRMGDDE